MKKMVAMVVPPDILTVVQDIANIATQISLGIFRGFLRSFTTILVLRAKRSHRRWWLPSFFYFFARGEALTNSVTDTLRSS